MGPLEAWLKLHQVSITLLVNTISAIVTLSAVLVAWRTASSTRATVSEMKEARLQAVRPVLYLLNTSHLARAEWNKTSADFPTLKFAKDNELISSGFELHNTVQSPAFNVTCDWRLLGNIGLPSNFKLATIQHAAAQHKKTVKYNYADEIIEYEDQDNSPFSFNLDRPFSKTSSTTHFEIVGNNKKALTIPSPIQNRLILLALTSLERYQIYKDWPDQESPIQLDIQVNCLSPSGETISRVFKFEISISMGFIYSQDNAIVARGNLPHDWAKLDCSIFIKPILHETPTHRKRPSRSKFTVQYGSIFKVATAYALKRLQSLI